MLTPAIPSGLRTHFAQALPLRPGASSQLLTEIPPTGETHLRGTPPSFRGFSQCFSPTPLTLEGSLTSLPSHIPMWLWPPGWERRRARGEGHATSHTREEHREGQAQLSRDPTPASEAAPFLPAAPGGSLESLSPPHCRSRAVSPRGRAVSPRGSCHSPCGCARSPQSQGRGGGRVCNGHQGGRSLHGAALRCFSARPPPGALLYPGQQVLLGQCGIHRGYGRSPSLISELYPPTSV